MKRKTRGIKVGVAVAVVVGAVAAGVVIASRDPQQPAAKAAILKTAEVTSGNLTTNEKIDGTVELSTTLDVLHRIEGQTSSANNNQTPNAQNASFVTGSVRAELLSSVTVPEPTDTSTTTPETTTPDTTVPQDAGTTTTTTPEQPADRGGAFPGGGAENVSPGGSAGGGGSSTGSTNERVTQTVTSVIATGAAVGLGDVL